MVHGQWITEHKPTFGPQVAERFHNAAKVTLAQRDEAERIRQSLIKTICDLLKDGTILCAPSTPDVAPLRGHADIPEVRLPLLRLTALASLSGVPVVSVPLWKRNNLPLGLSFMAGPGRDEDLLSALQPSFGWTNGEILNTVSKLQNLEVWIATRRQKMSVIFR